jgi:hypothetical protein
LLRSVFHVKRPGWIPFVLLCAIGSFACDSPSDVVFEDPPYPPVEVEPGVFRLTFGPGAAVARGFLPDGRLLFRAYDLPPLERDWLLVSVPPDGGRLREEARVYRTALIDDLGHLAVRNGRRLLVLWKAPLPGVHGCPDSSATVLGTPGPAPRTPAPIGLTIFALPEIDGTPVTAIPSRFVATSLVEGEGTLQQRVRVHPAARDADRTGANAFGPVVLPGGNEMIYSDGERIWRAAISDTSTVPALLGLGAYPTLSPDGGMLAFARPVGLDSVVRRFTVPVGLVVCVEEHVEIIAAGWDVVLRALGTDVEEVIASGLDPAFDPLGGRVVIRNDQLLWVDLGTGAILPIPGTTGGFAPIPSPDGELLAFSRLTTPTNSDVYFVTIPH